MGISNVDPINGPSFTPPTIAASGTSGPNTQQSAQQFAALLQAQMSSMMTSAALGSLNNNGSSGGLFGGSGSNDLLGGLFGGGSSNNLLGGLLGGLGGSSSLDGIMLMQTLQPLTEALNLIVDRLEALEGSDTPDVQSIDAPESLPFRDLIERMADKYQVPAAFLGAVMMAESAGDPNAVGDEGLSVGLFQLHERGMGAGLGDLRLDPELSASIGARGLAEGWHEGLSEGLEGEELVRFAYDFRFNPGGGDQYQGDSVYSYFRFYDALAARGGLAA